MIRQASIRAGRWIAAAVLVGLVGCAHESTRLQSADEPERERYDVKTVGEITSIGNADPIRVGGVGLVCGLNGTGGEAPPDTYRTLLEEDMRKQGIKNPKEILVSPENALVLVSALVPPGSAKGDPVDIQVTLPPRSKATSLRGGYLKKCVLYNYDYTRNLSNNPNYSGDTTALKGHRLAMAEGMVLVGFGDGNDSDRVKSGRIWSGGHCLEDMPLTLLLNQGQQFARVAGLITDRVNESFFGAARGLPGDAVAKATNNLAVYLRVPAQYKLNMQRYLRVVRLVPLKEQPETTGDPNHRPYRQRLAEDLLDPARTVTAALRLEALGRGSIQLLKPGLESKHPLVRFCAAESLAYLGSPSSGEELAECVRKQPRLRAYALTALASLDEAVSQVKLAELLTSASDDETRYGAFRALRTLNEGNSAVAGELLNDSFWLYRVAPEASSLVHITTTRRAEVVLFGPEARLLPPFSFLAGEFAVTASDDDQRCTISCFPIHGGAPARKQCSLGLVDVLKTLAEMGGQYPEAVELLQQAHNCHALSSRVRCDALPQAVSVYDLVKAGRSKKGWEETEDIVPAGQDLGSTPTLYETGLHSGGALDAQTLLNDKKTGKEAKSAARQE
jgi:hypothetical protein